MTDKPTPGSAARHAATCPWSVGFATCDCGLINLQVSKGSTMPAKYRKKPVVIEAAQWDGTAQGATPIIDWILGSGERSARYHEAPGRGDDGSDLASIAIDTLEGTMHATPRDFVIRGVQGEFYPCKPDIFEATYEPA